MSVTHKRNYVKFMRMVYAERLKGPAASARPPSHLPPARYAWAGVPGDEPGGGLVAGAVGAFRAGPRARVGGGFRAGPRVWLFEPSRGGGG